MKFFLKTGSKALPPICLFFMLLASCQTLKKDIHISSIDESVRINLLQLEEAIVNLESAPTANAINETRKNINSLAEIPDNDFQASLSAWSGRLYLLEGKPAEARRELGKSRTLNPGGWAAIILASRLETDVQNRLDLLDEALNLYGEIYIDRYREGIGEMQIERGRILLEQNRFSEAVASFDLAFNILTDKPFYRNNYLAARNRAWELRNIAEAGEKTLEIAGRDGITWLELVELTQSETDLLRFLTAGRDWPGEEIFRRLLERSFIPLTQDITLFEWPLAEPKSDEIVLRSGTAWFLWRLYAENRASRGLLSRYSSRYANMPNPRSPVNDLPLYSPFFDSILGCVELEFMNLPDGKNFFPEERVRGSVFLSMLKKIN